jgi:hypothetical protein
MRAPAVGQSGKFQHTLVFEGRAHVVGIVGDATRLDGWHGCQAHVRREVVEANFGAKIRGGNVHDMGSHSMAGDALEKTSSVETSEKFRPCGTATSRGPCACMPFSWPSLRFQAASQPLSRGSQRAPADGGGKNSALGALHIWVLGSCARSSPRGFLDFGCTIGYGCRYVWATRTWSLFLLRATGSFDVRSFWPALRRVKMKTPSDVPRRLEEPSSSDMHPKLSAPVLRLEDEGDGQNGRCACGIAPGRCMSIIPRGLTGTGWCPAD